MKYLRQENSAGIEDGVLALKVRQSFDGETGKFKLKGYCVLEKRFGAKPTLSLSLKDGSRRAVLFQDNRSGMLNKRYADESLNCEFARFNEFELDVHELPASLSATSQCNNVTIKVTEFSRNNIDETLALYSEQVENNSVDPEFLLQEMDNWSKEEKKSDLEILLRSSLEVLLHRHAGPYEANFLKLRKLYRPKIGLPRTHFRRVNALLNKSLSPHKFDGHGLTCRFKDLHLTESFWIELRELLAFLTQRFGTTFVESGTLLGLVREGGLLPHDDDIDLSIVLKATDANAAIHEWIEVKKELSRLGLVHEEYMSICVEFPLIKLKKIQDVPVDLFPTWIENGKVFTYPHTFGTMSEDELLPLLQDDNFNVPIPRMPIRSIEENYGKDWRTPSEKHGKFIRQTKRKFRQFIQNGKELKW